MGKRSVIALLVLACLLGMVGCGGQNCYQVDYDGDKDDYIGAKDRFRAGQTVTLYYTLIATDSDCTFYLDGDPIPFTYEEGKGFKVEFKMPAHDVKLECVWVNSMVYEPEYPEE